MSPPPLAIEISTPREIIITFLHPSLLFHDGYCLGVDIKALFGCDGTIPNLSVVKWFGLLKRLLTI